MSEQAYFGYNGVLFQDQVKDRQRKRRAAQIRAEIARLEAELEELDKYANSGAARHR